MSGQLNLSVVSEQKEEDKLNFLMEKSKYLKDLQKAGCFCNCTINVGGKLFKVHLEILCASSEYFDSIIRRDSDFEDIVTLHNMSPVTFQAILDYLYTGYVKITPFNVVDIYVAADFLILNSLLDRCRAFFQHIKDAYVEAGIKIVKIYDDEVIFKHIAEGTNMFKKKDLLRQLGPEYFFKFLQLKNRHSFIVNGKIYMGLHYVEKMQNIFNDVFPEDNRKITREDCEASVYFVPRDVTSSGFQVGIMPVSDGSVSHVDSHTYEPCRDFSPDTWAISKMIVYIIPSWGATPGLVGGIDLEYRNIWTGERKMAPSPLRDYLPQEYPIETVELEDGETVNGFTMNSGWLIDKVTFTTSKGRELGPLGRSQGGSRMKEVIPRTRDLLESYFFEEREGRIPSPLALHGFTFSLITTLGCPTWYRVRLVYSSVNAKLYRINGLFV